MRNICYQWYIVINLPKKDSFHDTIAAAFFCQSEFLTSLFMMAWVPEEGNSFGMLHSKMFQECLAVGVLIYWRVARPKLGQGQLCEVPQDEVMKL